MGIELQKFLNTPQHQYAQVKVEGNGNPILKTKPLPHHFDVRHMATMGWNKNHTERNTQTTALFISALQKEFNSEIANTVARTHFADSEKSKPLSHDKIQCAVHLAESLKSATRVANEVTLQNFTEAGLPALLQARNHPEWNQPAPLNQLRAMLKSHINDQGLQKLHPRDMPALANEVVAKAEELPNTCVKDLLALSRFIQSMDSQRTLQVLGDLSSHLAMHAQFELGSQGQLGADDQVRYQNERLRTLLSSLSLTEQLCLRDNLHVSPTCKELCSMLGSFDTRSEVQEAIAESGELQDKQAEMMSTVFGSQALVTDLLDTLNVMLDGAHNSARLQDWNITVSSHSEHGSPDHCDPEFVDAFARQLEVHGNMQAEAFGLSGSPARGLERRFIPIGDNTQLRQGLEESVLQADSAAPTGQFELDFPRGVYIIDGMRLDPNTDHDSVPPLLRPFATQGTLAAALLSLNEEQGMAYGVESQESRFYASKLPDGSYLLTCQQQMSPNMVMTTRDLDALQTRTLDPTRSRVNFEINLHIGMEEGRCFARPTAPIVVDCRHYVGEPEHA